MPAEVSLQPVVLGKLIPDPDNPKDHDLPAIMNSLRRHGYIELIVARPTRGGKFEIVSGHGRAAALELMRSDAPGMPPANVTIDENDWQVQVLVGRWKSRAEAHAYLIAANRTGELGGWLGDDAISAMLEEILTETGSLVGTGYDNDDLDALLRNVAASNADDDDNAWDGMPEFSQDNLNAVYTTSVHFPSHDDADAFFKKLGRERTKSFWWPAGDGHIGSDRTNEFIIDDDSE